MRKQYVIKNKDVPLAQIELGSDIAPRVLRGSLPQHLSIDLLGWLRSRISFISREHAYTVLKDLGLSSEFDMLDYSLGLSLNDTLWVCPEGCDLKWEDINLFSNPFDVPLARAVFDGVPCKRSDDKVFTVSPEFSTDGMLDKCWVRRSDGPCLMKAGTSGFSNTGWEPYCEVMADQILSRLGYPHARYYLETYRGRVVSRSPQITSMKTGMVSAHLAFYPECFYNIMKSFSQMGFGVQLAQHLIFDYLTCNVDRHAGNFSMLLDNETLQLCGMAPIYDNGASWLCYIGVGKHWSEYVPELLPKFYDSFEEGAAWGKLILGNSHNVERLIDFRFDRRRLGNMPEERILMVEDFLKHRVRCFFRL